jgi:hypothetical protein
MAMIQIIGQSNAAALRLQGLQFSEFVIHAKQDILEKGFGADVRASRSNAGGITF